MLAFHNNIEVKNKYITRVKHHMEADNLIRGVGWDEGKGCAVGCTLENYDHAQYPIELGIPEWLAHVEDTLFEGMSLEKSKTWPKDFLEAINVGADLESAKAPFLIMVLKSALETFDHEKFINVKKAIEGSIALWQRDDIGSDDWKNAARAAEVAAWAATEAAWATWAAARAAAAVAAWAAAAVAAWAAARAAWATARAAEVAAWAATEAAWATWAVKNDYFADELLSILKGIK